MAKVDRQTVVDGAAPSHLDSPASHRTRKAERCEGIRVQRRDHREDKADDAVAPGATHVYVREVPERGPASRDGSSLLWLYHSYVDEPKDVASALFGASTEASPSASGPIIVARMASRLATSEEYSSATIICLRYKRTENHVLCK